MRVKDTFTDQILDLSIAELLRRGAGDHSDQIRWLEDRVQQLSQVVGILLERSGLTDEEILRVTGAGHRYEAE